MSRSMKKANQEIFSYLKDYAEKSGRSVSYHERRIKLDEESQEWLKKLKIIVKQSVSLRLQFSFAEYDQNMYFISIGLDVDHDTIDERIGQYGLKRIDEENGGIFIALVSELKIPVRNIIKSEEVLEVFYNTEENKPEDYDYEAISKFFESIQIYKITNEFIFIDPRYNQEELWRLSVLFVSLLSSLIEEDTLPINLLNFTDETKEMFIKVCLEGNSSLSYENLFYSLTSFSWKHSFLEIYRCIEWLFEIVFLILFYRKIQIQYNDLTFSDFNLLFKESIGWKPKEEDALEKLFEQLDQEKLDCIKSITGHQSAHSYIYQLRCSIVHFSPDPRRQVSFQNLKDQEWNTIIKFCLMAVQELYKSNQSYLSE